MHVYDKAKYHTDAQNFPLDLPVNQAYVHTGMFIAWLAERGLLSPDTIVTFEDVLVGMRQRSLRPSALYQSLGGAFDESLLRDKGRSFATYYYDLDNGEYLNDYVELLADKLPTAYHVADTWENYDLIAKRITARYDEWQRTRSQIKR